MPLHRFTGRGHKLIAISVLALGGSLVSFFVFAAPGPNPVTSHSLIDFELNVPLASARITGSEIEAGTAIGIYIKAVYEFLVRAAAILAVMMFSYGGLLWLTAAGEKGRVGEAQKIMTNALIGLMLALGSYTILYAINPKLKDPSNVNPRLIAAKPVYMPSGQTNGACCYVANPGTSATISIGAPSEQHAFETIDQKTCEQVLNQKLQAKEVALEHRPFLSFCKYTGKDTSGMLPDVSRRFAQQMCWKDDPSLILQSTECPELINLSKVGEGYCSATMLTCPSGYTCNTGTGVCDMIPSTGLIGP